MRRSSYTDIVFFLEPILTLLDGDFLNYLTHSLKAFRCRDADATIDHSIRFYSIS